MSLLFRAPDDQGVKEGDRYTVKVLTGYVFHQHRPDSCRWSCTCGDCNGHTTEHPGTVSKVIHWMDNSVEAIVDCDDGKERSVQLDYPHGDACF